MDDPPPTSGEQRCHPPPTSNDIFGDANLKKKKDRFSHWGFLGFYHPKTQRKKKKKKKKPSRPNRGSRWPAMGLSAVGLLSFSQAISLSLLNDKKKEEGRRRVEGEAVGREKKWERRKNRRKKKK
jgi:hypothetical protein